MPTFEDEQKLFGYETGIQVMKAIREHGAKEAVVKMGGDGCLGLYDGEASFVESEVVTPVDTTVAGDSFNAGYLAARFKGDSGKDAFRAGHALAARVIQRRGAIIPA